MTALMDKMYIKLDKKEVPYKPQIYQRRGRGQNWCNFRQSNNWRRNKSLVQNVAMIIREDMEEVGVILEDVVFEVGLVIILDEMVVEIERIEGHGDSLDQQKEE